MPGIIPEVASGGVETRSQSGVCLNPGNVSNFYCPEATFTSDCAFLFLPDDCTARITAAQINAFQSELLCLAERFNPDGNWDCDSLCNLSTSFLAWATEESAFSLWRQMQTHSCNMPLTTVADLPAAASYMMCDGAGNLIRHVPEDTIGNPVVVGEDGITVTTTTGGDGTITYTVTNDCCPESLEYDEATDLLTLTYSGGQILTTTIANATVEEATGDGIDDFGNPIAIGDEVITFANGDILVATRNNATVAIATAAGVDSFGNPIAIGDEVITFANGDTLVATSNNAMVALATAAGVDSFGNNYVIGDEVITFANGDILAITGGEAIVLATTIECEVTTATGLTTDRYVSDFINQGHQFLGAAINNYTTPCNRSVIASADGSALAENSAAIASAGSSVDSLRSLITGQNNTTSGNSNNSITAGAGNVVTDSGSGFITGFLSSMTNGSSANIVGGNRHVLDNVDASSVTGSRITMTDSAGMVVSGTGNTINATTLSVVAGDRNVVNNAINSNINGTTNTVNGAGASYVNGTDNVVASVSASFIQGQRLNVVNAASDQTHDMVISGHDMTVSGADAFVSGARATVTDFISGMTAISDSIATDNIGSNLNGDFHSLDGLRRTIVNGRSLLLNAGNTAQSSIVGGEGPIGGPAASANRRYYINGVTGDAQFSGAVTAGFVFPGFGEYFGNPTGITRGHIVATDDGVNIRLADETDPVLGVTRDQLAMSAGGQIDPANAPYLIDDYGDAIWEDVQVEFTRPSLIVGNPDVTVTQTLRQHKPNPAYDPQQVFETIGVEFIGRVFIHLGDNHGLVAGDWIKPDVDGDAVKSKTQTRIRALTVNKGTVLALIT